MTKKIIIDYISEHEKRAAIVSNNKIELCDVETEETKTIKGNIYLGKIEKIEESLQAAFIVYDDQKIGFLPIGEVHPSYFLYPQQKDRKVLIQNVLKVNQLIPVQVLKDPQKNKGAFLSTYFNLLGQYCILMPNSDHRNDGVSRRLESTERERLKKIMQKMQLSEGMALILRSSGKHKTYQEIKADLKKLFRIWTLICEEYEKSLSSHPKLLYEEETFINRFLRDYYEDEVSEIIVNEKKIFSQIKKKFKKELITGQMKCEHYKEIKNIFSYFGIESEFQSMMLPLVKLPSGGSIVIQHTEALIAIDVNSWKTKEKTAEETVLKTNLEAAEMIASQIRLRSLNGIIVIDFIDMDSLEDKKKVEQQFKSCIKTNQIKLEIGKINEFGLLIVSRQRKKISFHNHYLTSCPNCYGTGKLKNKFFIAQMILEGIKEKLLSDSYNNHLIVYVSPGIDTFLNNHKRNEIFNLEKHFNCRIFIESKNHFYTQYYEITFAKKG